MSEADPEKERKEGFIRESYARMKQASRGFSPQLRRSGRRFPDSSAEGDSGAAGGKTSAKAEGADGSSGWVAPAGIAKSLSGTGRSPRDPKALGAVLSATANRRRWTVSLSVGSLADAWPQIVGESVAQHSTIEALDGGRLLVRADSTAWAKQLQLLVPQMEKRIDDVVGPGKIVQVIVHGPKRPSWRHGPRTVPGRGPRDTYG